MNEDWPSRRSYRWDAYDVATLARRKEAMGLGVSLVVPARDEVATVGGIVSRLHDALVETARLVDEIVVIDSDSADGTGLAAAEAGAVVHRSADIRPELGSVPGKGEAMWKSQFVTSGDLVVFMDADLVEWDTHFVPGLLAPLLHEPDVQLVKGFYERPMLAADGGGAYDGGRVTELVARPLLALAWPELAGLIQPLAGEWAVRRDHLASLSIPTGYAVELAAVVDTLERCGLDAIAQVDLGRRGHSHQSLHDLGAMAVQIMAAVERRRGHPAPETVALRQFVPGGAGLEILERTVRTGERPPVGVLA